MSDARTAFRERASAEKARREAAYAMKKDAEDDFLCFVRMFWPVLEPTVKLIEGWVLDLLADVMMSVTDGHMTKVIINVPPGSMKSSLLNVLWPAWEWGPQNMPHMRYLSISYSTSVPERDNIRFARVVQHPTYRKCWGDRFMVTRDGMELVENDKTGWKRVTSTGGGVTGHRGDRILLDDLNNPMNVESEDVRSATNRFVREIMPDRLNNMETSAVVNLQQRTNEADATATLIAHGEGYQTVCVPMEFDPLRIFPVVLRRDEDGTPSTTWVDPRSLGADGEQLDGLYVNPRGELKVQLGSPMAKAEGALCWPERFPPDAMMRLKATKGPYAWDAQYNQFPGVRGGGVIRRDWWQLWPEEAYPELGTVVVSVDTALEEGVNNDFNACTAWGAFAGEHGEPLFLLIDAWRARMPLAELTDRVVATCRRRKADYLLIEHKTRGRDLHDEILRLNANATWQTVLIKVDQAKVARLKAVSHLFSGDYRVDPVSGIETFSGGIVYAPEKEWADDVINEVTSFPYGAHDDLVDCVSLALSWCRRNGVVLRKVEWEDGEIERQRYRKPASVPYAI